MSSLKVWNGPNTFLSKIQFGGQRPCTTHTTYRRPIFWRRQLHRISSRYKEWHPVTRIDDIFFLVLISTETHSLHLNCLHFCLIFKAHITKQRLFTEWQRTALCHLASLFCAVCRPSILTVVIVGCCRDSGTFCIIVLEMFSSVD